MRLNGWTWLIAGAIISIMSGYVYLTIPKNGQPNTAMALFFFVGIVFIVVGIIKVFFRRIDDQSVMDSIKTVEQPQPKIVTMPNNVQNANIDSRPNRVDETIAQMMQQEQSTSPLKSSQTPTATTAQAQNVKEHHTSHTNSFSKLYEYKGPVHTTANGTHAQHPVTQHTQQTGTTNQTSTTHTAQHHPVQNTTEHSIKCKKCGNANTGSSNYCHQCGNRLR